VFCDASPPLDGVWWGFLCRIVAPTPALGSPCPDVSTRWVSFSCSGCSLVLASRIAMRWVSSQCWGVIAVLVYRCSVGVSSWFRGVFAVLGHHFVLVAVLEASVGGNGRMESENEPRQTSWLTFHDALYGPPTSWVPHCVSLSPIPLLSNDEPALEGEG